MSKYASLDMPPLVPLGNGYARTIPHGSPLWLYAIWCLNTACDVTTPNVSRFPFTLPVSFSRRDINTVFFNHDFAVGIKGDGQHGALIFGNFEQCPVVIFGVRGPTFHLLAYDVPSPLVSSSSKPTVIDGEWIQVSHTDEESTQSVHRHVFQTIDVHMVGGESVRQLAYTKRLQIGLELLHTLDVCDANAVRTSITDAVDMNIDIDDDSDDSDDDDDSDDKITIGPDSHSANDNGYESDTSSVSSVSSASSTSSSDEDGGEAATSVVGSGLESGASVIATLPRHLDALQASYSTPLMDDYAIGGGSKIRWFTGKLCPFDISIKHVFPMQCVDFIRRVSPTLCYPNDGLCFTSIQTNTAPLKWKPVHTIDFHWVKVGGKIDTRTLSLCNSAPKDSLGAGFDESRLDVFSTSLESSCVRKDGRDRAQFALLVSTRRAAERLVFSHQYAPDECAFTDEQLDGRIVECVFDATTTTWLPKIIRATKPHPNSHFVVCRTLVNILENVSLDELTCDDNTVFHPDYASPLATSSRVVVPAN